MEIINATDLKEKDFIYPEVKREEIVVEILDDVKKNGDAAIKKYTKQFDGIDLDNIQISKEEIAAAYEKITPEEDILLKKVIQNIKEFAVKQFEMFKDIETKRDGLTLGHRIVPIEKVGCYVPGGRYPLPSSALMNIIPAKVAGVKEIVVCFPKCHYLSIVAADMAGADKIFNVGGAQAIGAMAYGTKSVPKVNLIVGPGNKYVASAKKEVYGVVGIDFIAGPSEVLVIADETGNPDFIAADLIAQAEHDPNAVSDLITTSKEIAESVLSKVKDQLVTLAIRETAEKSLKNGKIILVDTLEEAVALSNKKAPEHLELQVEDPDRIIPDLINYGSLFIGNYSAEVFGDYVSGTNHTLPTSGASKYTGGLSVANFVKILTYQKMDKNSCKELATLASDFASLEGLAGHNNAARIRMEK